MTDILNEMKEAQESAEEAAKVQAEKEGLLNGLREKFWKIVGSPPGAFGGVRLNVGNKEIFGLVALGLVVVGLTMNPLVTLGVFMAVTLGAGYLKGWFN